MRDFEARRLEAALEHIGVSGNLDGFSGTKSERIALVVRATKRRLITWSKTHGRYELTPSGRRRVVKAGRQPPPRAWFLALPSLKTVAVGAILLTIGGGVAARMPADSKIHQMIAPVLEAVSGSHASDKAVVAYTPPPSAPLAGPPTTAMDDPALLNPADRAIANKPGSAAAPASPAEIAAPADIVAVQDDQPAKPAKPERRKKAAHVRQDDVFRNPAASFDAANGRSVDPGFAYSQRNNFFAPRPPRGLGEPPRRVGQAPWFWGFNQQ